MTWSFGCTARLSRSPASVAITSFAFMLDEVPDPVWKTSTGNCSSQRPSATSPAAAAIASPSSASSTPSRTLTRAAACLTNPSALMCAAESGTPEIGKFSTARCVCACHLACTGTRTSPIESCSIRSAAACSPIPPTVRPHVRAQCVPRMRTAHVSSAASRPLHPRRRRAVAPRKWPISARGSGRGMAA